MPIILDQMNCVWQDCITYLL